MNIDDVNVKILESLKEEGQKGKCPRFSQKYVIIKLCGNWHIRYFLFVREARLIIGT